MLDPPTKRRSPSEPACHTAAEAASKAGAGALREVGKPCLGTGAGGLASGTG